MEYNEEIRNRRLGRKTAPPPPSHTPDDVDPTPPKDALDLPSDGDDTPPPKHTAPAPSEGTGASPPDVKTNNDISAVEASLKAQLDAAIGRLAPTQRHLEEATAASRAAQLRIAELEEALLKKNAEEEAARLKAEADEFDPFEGIPEEELELLDDNSKKLLASIAKATYARSSKKAKDAERLALRIDEERERARAARYKTTVVKDLNLRELGESADFRKFLDEDDSAVLLMNRFFDQTTTREELEQLEPRLRKVVKRYASTTGAAGGSKTDNRLPDAQTRLSSHMDRTTSASAGSGKLTSAEVTRLVNDAKRLSRLGKHKEAKAIMDKIK